MIKLFAQDTTRLMRTVKHNPIRSWSCFHSFADTIAGVLTSRPTDLCPTDLCPVAEERLGLSFVTSQCLHQLLCSCFAAGLQLLYDWSASSG